MSRRDNHRDRRDPRDARDPRDLRDVRDARDPRDGPDAGDPAPRRAEYFVPGEGISREVIQADICRYLGPDALVKPMDYNVCRPTFAHHLSCTRADLRCRASEVTWSRRTALLLRYDLVQIYRSKAITDSCLHSAGDDCGPQTGLAALAG